MNATDYLAERMTCYRRGPEPIEQSSRSCIAAHALAARSLERNLDYWRTATHLDFNRLNPCRHCQVGASLLASYEYLFEPWPEPLQNMADQVKARNKYRAAEIMAGADTAIHQMAIQGHPTCG